MKNVHGLGWAALAMVWLVGGCGGSAPPAATQPAATATIDWGAMSPGEKADRMKKVVTPKMRAVFQAFDAEDFQEFNCETCHGPGAKARHFKMPNPDLPRLTVADRFKKHREEHPKATQFMMEKVVPEMAAALGMQPYNPETHQGFGCFGCHVEDK